MNPLDDRIIVQPVDKDEKSSGGIIIPEKAREKATKGTVLAAGPGKFLDSGVRKPMDVKVGNVIIYGKYSGVELEIEDNKIVVMREADVLMVL